MERSRKEEIEVTNEPEPNIKELVRRCLSTPVDEEAWYQFYHLFFRPVEQAVKRAYLAKTRYGQGQSLRLSEDEVADLTQAVFQKLIENDRQALRQFNNKYAHSIYAWFNIIAIHVVIDFLREVKATKRPEIIFSLSEVVDETGELLLLNRLA